MRDFPVKGPMRISSSIERILAVVLLSFAFLRPSPVPAQDEEFRFKVVDVRGRAFVAGGPDSSSARLRMGAKVDDGEWVTTQKGGEAVLRLPGKAYVLIAPNTRIRVSRLRLLSEGPECQISLISGRILVQLDEAKNMDFLISTAGTRARAHGTLFEALRRGEEFSVISFKGAVVATAKRKPDIARGGQMLHYEKDRFRYKRYSLKPWEEAHREEWARHFADIQAGRTGPAKKH